jgi:energy-coupling factor transport system permease protein
MQELAFLRHLTLGQYLPRESFVHRLDPRTKLLGLGLLALAVSTSASYAANILLLGFSFLVSAASRINPGQVLRGLKPAWPLILFFAAIQAAFYDAPFGPTRYVRVLLEWGPFTLTNAGLRVVVVSIMRLVVLWMLTTLLTNTTTISELARGAERLLEPFGRFGLPAYELSLVFTLALRFVPVFATELEDALKARIVRGAPWRHGRFALLRNAHQIASLLVPLFADALRRADELANAMAARCYVSGAGRTHLLALRFRRADWLSLGLVAAVSLTLIALRNAFAW